MKRLKLFPWCTCLNSTEDILFAVKSIKILIKIPTDQFCITNYIAFSSTNTTSSASNKLIHPRHLNNVSRHSYFHQLPLLWNAMPVIDLNLSFPVIKHKLKSYLWNHLFLRNFNDNINYTYHFLCPCSRCHQSKPPTTNLHHL